MINAHYEIVVVGASVAAEALASRLREHGFSGEIVVIDRDPRMPYERPPLSKHYLTRPEHTEIEVDWDPSISVVPGDVTAVNPETKTLTVVGLEEQSATEVGYDTLVIASGAAPVVLPIEPDGVLKLRTVDDAERIRDAVSAGTRVSIIGAGAIGAELATSLAERGAEVVLLDKADRPLERLLAGHLGADVTSWLISSGIECRWSVDLTHFERDGQIWTLAFGDGSTLECDVVISAVGVKPVTGWLAGSGLLTDGSLLCDEVGRVIAPGGTAENVFAIGDVVTHVTPTGERYRTESWTAASVAGVALADRLMNVDASPPEPAYFWTDVAGRKIQVLGELSREGVIDVEFENPNRGAILYRVSGEDGAIGWIGVNAPQKIALLRMEQHA